MNRILFSLGFVLMIETLTAQRTKPLFPLSVEQSIAYELRSDSLDFCWSCLESVYSKLGFEKDTFNVHYFRFNSESSYAPLVFPIYSKLEFVKDGFWIVNHEKQKFSAGSSAYFLGFRSFLPDESHLSEKNMSRFLMSCYHQEEDSVYAADNNNFIELPLKDLKYMRRRAMFSLGYAKQYITDDNPLMPSKWRYQVLGYALDVFGYVSMTSVMLFLLHKPYEYLGVLAGYATVRFAFGGMMSLLNRQRLKQYNILRNAPYKVPKELVD